MLTVSVLFQCVLGKKPQPIDFKTIILDNLDMVSNWKPAATLQSFIVGRMTLKITALYVRYGLLIWNQGLEFAKQVLAASRIRHKMCSTLMAQSFPLHKEVSMLTTDTKYI